MFWSLVYVFIRLSDLFHFILVLLFFDCLSFVICVCVVSLTGSYFISFIHHPNSVIHNPFFHFDFFPAFAK